MLATALLPALLVSTPPIDPALAERFARLALACVHQEYPNKIAHVMDSDADARPPRELTPAFFGCYDWHSSVHGHWLLARVARLRPETPLAAEARQALARSLTADKLAAETRYLEGKGRVSFERPYGLAWLLQLAAELREWGAPEAREWASSLAPLEKGLFRGICGLKTVSGRSSPRSCGTDALVAFAASPRATLGRAGVRAPGMTGPCPRRPGVPRS